MTETKDTRDWTGLYLPEDDGEPVALFREGAHVTALLHQHLGRTDGVTAATRSMGVNPQMRDYFRAQQAPAAEAGEPVGIARLRAQVRHDLEQEALRAHLEAEEREAMGLPARKDAPKVPDKAAEALGVPPEHAAPKR